MANGGFLVKFDGKDDVRCYAISFDYDGWRYIVNEQEKHPLPRGVKNISVEVEFGEEGIDVE